MDAVTDYDEEGEKLLAALNIDLTRPTCQRPGVSKYATYNDLDCIWQHPTSSAKVFVGNQRAAASIEILRNHGITHIVNCQDVSAVNYHEADPTFTYFRFSIALWPRDGANMKTLAGCDEYLGRLFSFVDEATDGGHSVLIHCLAGAHRAGSTGVAFMMHKGKANLAVTLALAKRVRPAINPIGNLMELLRRWDSYRTAAQREEA